MSEQSANHVEHRSVFELEGREEIEHNVVVVPRVQCDLFSSAAIGHGSDYLERSIAIERRDLDRHEPIQLGDASPEAIREIAPANCRLQVEPHDRNDLRHGSEVLDCPDVGPAARMPKVHQPDVKATIIRQRGFGPCLLRVADDPGHANDGCSTGALMLRDRFGCEGQYGLVQAHLGVMDGELGRVNPNGESACARGEVIARERPLPAFVKPSIGRHRQRMSGNDQTTEQAGANVLGVQN